MNLAKIVAAHVGLLVAILAGFVSALDYTVPIALEIGLSLIVGAFFVARYRSAERTVSRAYLGVLIVVCLYLITDGVLRSTLGMRVLDMA